ncbi:conserved hypothetical protein [Candidatus Methylobacter favarea]|uniref:DUF2380 domain-containing protein n=1 Tax=Candidatus Methylobacter favarea TaxID=2707345 RepID=A0A8S0WMC1_9GAMM|nr:DUF2380 domain-containing protein [Candidatus Methylobacter favarea]CAA9889640.1 conserved hypothetical protein [Candidatus Methylobacter favarea]
MKLLQLNKKGLNQVWMIAVIGLIMSNSVNAATRIAILNFELNDITSLPNTPAESSRTGSIKPLLEQALNNAGNYEIIHINADAQKAANSGFGYLFRFTDAAAKLGRQFGADWVIVGQHSKPSFLYSYLMAHLINVKTQHLAGSYAIELKGSHEKVMHRGVKALADKITETVNQ